MAIVTVALLLMLLVLYFLIRPVRIKSGAMSPAYPAGCVVFVTREWGIPERGEVAAFTNPTDGSGEIYVRRVIAVGGDTFRVSDSETVTIPDGFVLVRADDRDAAAAAGLAAEELVDARSILGVVRFALGN